MRSHKAYMAQALKLAAKAQGQTSPNPLVGALVVKRGQIVGKGYHKKAGTDHAEVMALNEAQDRAKNATLYVTLEPCSHWGRTPPCTDRIVQSGIREIIIGTKDPNPKVNGAQELKAHGLKFKMGILENEINNLNEAYNLYIRQNRPFVVLKVATTLDGKIATRAGESKYISGLAARTKVHQMRSIVDAVIIGSRTVLKDDPQLTTRLVRGRNPRRIVVDSKCRVPLSSKIFRDPQTAMIVTTEDAPAQKVAAAQQLGITVLPCKSRNSKVDLKQMLTELAKRDITHVMVEGGAQLNGAFLASKLVDKMMVFIAPDVLGDGISSIGDLGIKKLSKALKLTKLSTDKVGKDILVQGYVVPSR